MIEILEVIFFFCNESICAGCEELSRSSCTISMHRHYFGGVSMQCNVHIILGELYDCDTDWVTWFYNLLRIQSRLSFYKMVFMNIVILLLI